MTMLKKLRQLNLCKRSLTYYVGTDTKTETILLLTFKKEPETNARAANYAVMADVCYFRSKHPP